ncbi:MAG: 3-(3-hydroxyphenyl)propionate hydroxylase [Rhodospirillaceae bacterium]|nr:3-(3-hydroxyphenyl)propionate hydroxylase [Rhodospirillaceae bacterium]
MKNLPKHTQVAIIGAGPVGLMAANLLGRLGVETVLIERNAAPYDVPRAITMDDEGARTLQAAGLDGKYMSHTVRGRGSRYYDDKGLPFADVGPGPVEYGFARRNHFFQPDYERVLRQGLERFPHVSLAFEHDCTGHEQAAKYVTLTLQTPDGDQSLRADYLLAADGARSPTRNRLGIGMLGDTYPEDWLILDMRSDPDEEPVSKFFCRSDRPFVSIPAPRGGRRYEFRARPGETPESLTDPAKIRALLEPIRPFDDAEILRATVYTFEAKIAERWSCGRVFLMGDAAHLTPPFAGQGLNAGLRDAHNLTWKIWAVVTGKAGPGLLPTYETERRGPAWAMVQLAVAMGDIVMPESAADIAFRTSILTWMERFPEARDYIIGMKFKPPPRYNDGAFVKLEDQPFAGSLVGQMMPQPDVAHADNVLTRLDDVIGPGFALIAQQPDTIEAMTNSLDVWSVLQPTPVAITKNSVTVTKDVAVLAPQPDHAWKTLRAHRDQIMLVRPDRYVAAACWPGEVAEMARSFCDILHAK